MYYARPPGKLPFRQLSGGGLFCPVIHIPIIFFLIIRFPAHPVSNPAR